MEEDPPDWTCLCPKILPTWRTLLATVLPDGLTVEEAFHSGRPEVRGGIVAPPNPQTTAARFINTLATRDIRPPRMEIELGEKVLDRVQKIVALVGEIQSIRKSKDGRRCLWAIEDRQVDDVMNILGEWTHDCAMVSPHTSVWDPAWGDTVYLPADLLPRAGRPRTNRWRAGSIAFGFDLILERLGWFDRKAHIVANGLALDVVERLPMEDAGPEPSGGVTRQWIRKAKDDLSAPAKHEIQVLAYRVGLVATRP